MPICGHCRRKKKRGRHVCPTFDCSICGKTFNRNDYKKKHERTHSNNPLTCNICTKSGFSTKESLKQHTLIHETVICERCQTECNARTIKTHTCGAKHGGTKTYSKLSQQSVLNIINKVKNREPIKGNITKPEIRALMEEEAKRENISLFKESNHSRSSQRNRFAVTTFCRDYKEHIVTRSNYDVIIPPNEELTELQMLCRLESDEEKYNAMTPDKRVAIQSSCIIKTTSKQQENKKRTTSEQNRDMDFRDKVWDRDDVINEKIDLKQRKKLNKNKKKKKTEKMSDKQEEDSSDNEEFVEDESVGDHIEEFVGVDVEIHDDNNPCSDIASDESLSVMTSSTDDHVTNLDATDLDATDLDDTDLSDVPIPAATTRIHCENVYRIEMYYDDMEELNLITY